MEIANEILMHFRNIKKTAGDIYINDTIETDKDGSTLSLIDLIADDINIVDNIDLRMRIEKLYEFVDTFLDERERKIVTMRYGLKGFVPMTQREVAIELKISRSYVSRIEKKALHTLRKKFEQG